MISRFLLNNVEKVTQQFCIATNIIILCKEVHSIEETRKCRVAYLKIDLARRQHEEFVMHLPNEHLSNNLVMKWLRDIPPIAEYRFFRDINYFNF